MEYDDICYFFFRLQTKFEATERELRQVRYQFDAMNTEQHKKELMQFDLKKMSFKFKSWFSRYSLRFNLLLLLR
jgi:hypothetical protein